MEHLEIAPAALADVVLMAADIRAADRVEIAAYGFDPATALEHGVASGAAYTATFDGRPIAMFGWVVTSAIEGEGRPWLLGTDAVYRQGRALLTIGPAWIDRMFDSIRTASNLVASGNVRAIRLLRRWGFEVEQGEQMVGGVAFRRFVMERG